jgi:hypothetical protein
MDSKYAASCHLIEESPTDERAREIPDEFFTFLSNYKPKNRRSGYSNTTMSLYIIAVKEFLNSQNLLFTFIPQTICGVSIILLDKINKIILLISIIFVII